MDVILALSVHVIYGNCRGAYKAKVKADLSTRLAIFRQYCQCQATANEYEECLGEVNAAFDSLDLVLRYSHFEVSCLCSCRSQRDVQ